MGQAVVHFEILGNDVEALRTFYGELFGWEIDANNPRNYGVVSREGNTNADGAGLRGGIGPASQSAPSRVTFYVEVPDVAFALAHAERLGGRRLHGPEKVREGIEVGTFADPEGHLIGLLRAQRSAPQ